MDFPNIPYRKYCVYSSGSAQVGTTEGAQRPAQERQRGEDQVQLPARLRDVARGGGKVGLGGARQEIRMESGQCAVN